MKTFVGMISVLVLAGCGGVAPTAPVTVAAAPPVAPVTTPAPPTTPTTPPVTQPTAPVVMPPPVFTPPPVSTPAPPVVTPTPPPPPAANAQKIVAWGNSQTMGSGTSDACGQTNPCESPYSWAQVMATDKGWNLDNQSVGGSLCADLSAHGATESLWDEEIGAGSVNIYAMFHNEQSWFGGLGPIGVLYARNCIEAQTAWLAIPETQKVRAINCAQTGTWTAGPDSASAQTTQAGATLTCTVTGKIVYFSTARFGIGEYSVSFDGAALTDPDTGDTTWEQLNKGSFAALANFIRIAGLSNSAHTFTYTCLNTQVSPCIVFYAAGLDGTPVAPVVYSVSPFPNASWNTQGYFDPATSNTYREAWVSLAAELEGDGLNVVPLDVIQAYDPNTQTIGDGIHPNVAGDASIGAYAATLNPAH